MNFEERLQKAIDRGTDRREQKADQAQSAALSEEELKRLHSSHRLNLRLFINVMLTGSFRAHRTMHNASSKPFPGIRVGNDLR